MASGQSKGDRKMSDKDYDDEIVEVDRTSCLPNPPIVLDLITGNSLKSLVAVSP